MNSAILKSMGLENVDIGYIFIVLFAVLIIILILSIIQIVNLSKYKKKYAKFMQGKNAKSLENDIIGLYNDNKFITTAVERNRNDIKIIFKNLESTFQKIGIVKYDAFNQMGGKLSFSLALLDGENNGFILNSVHSTDGCYSYTKEVKSGNSKNTLSEEEKQALYIAIGSENI